MADHLQPGGDGILEVLNDPEPATFVERDRDGLTNDRLGQHQIELEITGNLEGGQGRARRERALASIKREAILRRRTVLPVSRCAILGLGRRLAVEGPENGVLEQAAELGPLEITGVSQGCVENARGALAIDPGDGFDR